MAHDMYLSIAQLILVSWH